MLFILGGVRFAADGTEPLVVTSFDPGERALRSSDITIDGQPGAIPSSEVENAGTWQFTISALGDTDTETLDHIAALAAAWRPAALDRPATLVPLRYRLAGRWRRVYGRPGQFSDPDAAYLDQGEAEALGAFRLLDPLHYDDTETAVDMGIVPASSALLKFPATPPFVWRTAGGETSRFAEVGGDSSTPVRIVFRGPVTRPWVRVGGVRVELTGTLAYDQTVTVDSRLLTVTRQNGASAAALLAPRTRLADLRLAPGRHEVTFGGTDETGTASVTVAWRDAWRSL